MIVIGRWRLWVIARAGEGSWEYGEVCVEEESTHWRVVFVIVLLEFGSISLKRRRRILEESWKVWILRS